MKTRATCYLRIAKGPRGVKFAATAKPSADPLRTGSGYQADSLPTRQIKLVLDLPEDFFGPDATVTVAVPTEAAEVLVDVQPVEVET